MRPSRSLLAVLAVLMTTGWAANHFSAVIPALQEREGLSAVLLDGVFGVYAVGLLPGLFGGGALSDRLGRPRVVLPGATLAAAGTVVLLVDHGSAGLFAGRLVVGLGAGLTFGAGTAWAADLAGASGTVLAGVLLTAGFAVGPLVSGVLAQWAPAPLELPFVVSLVLSLAAVGTAYAVGRAPAPARGVPVGGAAATPRSAGLALRWSLPVGLLVFASPSMAIVTLPTRLPARYDGPLLVGLACAVTLVSGIVVQAVARRQDWGPRCGVAGAAFFTLGFLVAALGGRSIGLPLFALSCVSLGLAYGLCLREGLLDVETLAPTDRRGLLTGVYYVATYVGFGLPVLLVAVRPAVGITAPALVAAAVGLVVAATRTVQLRPGHPGRLAAAAG